MIKTPTGEYSISNSHSYAAGSWGCDLPGGKPAEKYPWTWAWLVIPADKVPSGKMISFITGTAAFQDMSGLPNVEGGYIGVDDGNLSIIKEANISKIPLVATSTDGTFKFVKVEQHAWGNYTDEFGTAVVPLIQIFTGKTEKLTVIVKFYPKVDDYFRLPITIEKKGQLLVFSDFRAVGVKTHFYMARNEGSEVNVIFDDYVETNNAVEFAYMAPVNDKLKVEF